MDLETRVIVAAHGEDFMILTFSLF